MINFSNLGTAEYQQSANTSFTLHLSITSTCRIVQYLIFFCHVGIISSKMQHHINEIFQMSTWHFYGICIFGLLPHWHLLFLLVFWPNGIFFVVLILAFKIVFLTLYQVIIQLIFYIKKTFKVTPFVFLSCFSCAFFTISFWLQSRRYLGAT